MVFIASKGVNDVV
jgi:hypothetical protein